MGWSKLRTNFSLSHHQKNSEEGGFLFLSICCSFFLHFLMSFEEAPGKQIAIFKKGTHIHIHLGLPGCVCVAFF